MRTHFAEKSHMAEAQLNGSDSLDYWSFGIDQYAFSSGGETNKLYAIAFLNVINRIVSRMAIEVDSTGGASVRLGLYSCFRHKLYPHRLVVDAGTISGGTGGHRYLDLATPVKLRGNRIYFIAVATNQGAGAPYWGSPGVAGGFEFCPSFAGMSWCGMGLMSVAHTWGALPDPFTDGATAYKGARGGADYTYGVLMK